MCFGIQLQIWFLRAFILYPLSRKIIKPFKDKIVKIATYIKIQISHDYGNFKKDKNEEN